MKIKVSELQGPALDWAVAKAIGEYKPVAVPAYSTDWAQGGPIIEREGIGTYKLNGAWSAHCPVKGSIHACMDGQPTALIAAMRAYVASKMGDEIEIPEELK